MSEEIKTELNEDETVCLILKTYAQAHAQNLRLFLLNPFFRRMTSKSLVHLTIQGKKMIQMA